MVKSLINISKFLSGHTATFVISIAVLTFIFPDIFLWVKGNIQTLILGIIMLSMGMTLTKEDFRILAERPMDIFIGACAQFTIMPLIAWGVSRIPGITPGIAVGLILVGCCPGGVSSNIMSFLCKGDVAFSVGMTTASTLLAPVITPMLVLFLAGEKIDVDAWGMFQSILLVTILPVAVGFVANLLWGGKSGFVSAQKMMPGLSVIGLACIVGGVISYNGSHFFTSGLVIFLAIFLHNGLGYLLGYNVGKLTGMSQPKKRTIAIEVGMQNAGLATNLATRHFSVMPEVAVASAVSCVWHSISGTILASIFIRIDAYREKKNMKK